MVCMCVFVYPCECICVCLSSIDQRPSPLIYGENRGVNRSIYDEFCTKLIQIVCAKQTLCTDWCVILVLFICSDEFEQNSSCDFSRALSAERASARSRQRTDERTNEQACTIRHVRTHLQLHISRVQHADKYTWTFFFNLRFCCAIDRPISFGWSWDFRLGGCTQLDGINEERSDQMFFFCGPHSDSRIHHMACVCMEEQQPFPTICLDTLMVKFHPGDGTGDHGSLFQIGHYILTRHWSAVARNDLNTNTHPERVKYKYKHVCLSDGNIDKKNGRKTPKRNNSDTLL